MLLISSAVACFTRDNPARCRAAVLSRSLCRTTVCIPAQRNSTAALVLVLQFTEALFRQYRLQIMATGEPALGAMRKCSRGCVLDYLSAWTSHLQMILLIAILTVYLLVGASVFQRLESPNEHERIEHAVQNHSLLERTKAFIIGNLTNKGSISQAEALELIYVFGNISGSEAKLSLTHNWDFGPSVFFVTTVITTIGKTILTNNFSLYAVYLFMQDMVVLLRRLKKEEFS